MTISPSSLSHVLAAYGILGRNLFSLSHLKVLVYCVLASVVTGENSAVSLIVVLIDNLFFSLKSLLWCCILTLMFNFHNMSLWVGF